MEAISRTQAKKQLQERQREWLRQILGATGQKPAQIAARAGVSDTTLSRLLNNPDYSGTLSEVTIERIKTTYNLPGPGEPPTKAIAGGNILLIAEGERLSSNDLSGREAGALHHLFEKSDASEIWRLRSSALEGVGYLPGDLLLVDTAGVPRPQDVVCAVITDWQRGGTETVWRIYEPPFLISSAPRGTASKPLLVDNERVAIKGVVVASLRPHRLSTAS